MRRLVLHRSAATTLVGASLFAAGWLPEHLRLPTRTFLMTGFAIWAWWQRRDDHLDEYRSWRDEPSGPSSDEPASLADETR